jgi:hypothetical protein
MSAPWYRYVATKLLYWSVPKSLWNSSSVLERAPIGAELLWSLQVTQQVIDQAVFDWSRCPVSQRDGWSSGAVAGAPAHV